MKHFHSITHSYILLLSCSALAQASFDVRDEPHLIARADCSTQTVASGDSCGSLASKCGISGNDFSKYNSDPNLCSTLQPGQIVCCSSGTLPDRRPKQASDGSCATYTVVSGDTCAGIAATNGLKVADLSTFNDRTTWGWSGCDNGNLRRDTIICLSSGSPPLPKPVDGVVCGPQKPGTQKPSNGDLASLNGCPLNACCDIWGQCGITPEFCSAESGVTGNSGTAPPGRNGCISNCGTGLVSLRTPPAQINVGYYESWNWDRPCLNMLVDDVDKSKISHLHWAFASVDSTNFFLSANDSTGQWSRFVKLQGIKRIVSIGGWGFSTEPGTYNILRQAMRKPQAFANNIVYFLNVYNLDGIDIDWEYPGAPASKGVPAGDPSDGYWYYVFLYYLRQAMPAGKTISIAAPASYWYLRGFPIVPMSQMVDYIVYMTYDLHGQWDWDNQWASEGCPQRNCLRSHVNITETAYALSMLTKAGVTTDKIVVGISSYGRAFKMTNGFCVTPDCQFTGPDSGATPGRCTNEPGYIANAEIDEQIFLNGVRPAYDYQSGAEWLIYGDMTWVSYMSLATKQRRADIYKAYSFAGTADWAISQQSFQSGLEIGTPEEEEDWDSDVWDDIIYYDCPASYTSLTDLDNDAGKFPTQCVNLYSLQALSATLNSTIDDFSRMMAQGYDGKFNTYAQSMVDQASTSLAKFVLDHGNDYFSCVVAEATLSCKCCGSQPSSKGDNCKGCFDGDCTVKRDEISAAPWTIEPSLNTSLIERSDVGSNTIKQQNVKWVKYSEPCPPDYSQRGSGDGKTNSIWWTMRQDKNDLFYTNMTSATGIKKEKIAFGDRTHLGIGTSCGAWSVGFHPDDPCWNLSWDYNVPIVVGYGTSDVANPKDTMTQALANATSLREQLKGALTQVEYHSWDSLDPSELVDAVSLPIFMMQDAVEQMKSIVETAEKIEEAKRIQIILAIFGALLFFIPVAGQVIGAVAGVAEIAAVAITFGVVGELAMGIYAIVSDPDHPMAGIMGIVMAPLGLTSVTKVSQAAALRRGMTEAAVGKLGAKVAAGAATLRKVASYCARH